MSLSTATATNRKNPKTIQGVLIDLSGTIHIGDEEIHGARNALRRLREAAAKRSGKSNPLIVRFLTNTSTKSVANLLGYLNDESTLNFGISNEELITSLRATANYVRKQNLNPLLLLEDASDFDGTQNPTQQITTDDKEPLKLSSKDPTLYDSVVLGLAPSKFCYEHLNEAFQILVEHPDNLIAVHRGNYLREKNQGKLNLGPGAFITALETASACSPAKIVGKPSPEIFHAAIQSINRELNTVRDGDDDDDGDGDLFLRPTIIQAKNVCMIGDDVWADCQGAFNAGIGTSILVQTGKYRSGDEDRWKAQTSSVSSSGNSNRPMGEFLVRSSIVEAIEYVLQIVEQTE